MSEEFREQISRIDRIEVTLTHAVDAIEKISLILNKPNETKWGPLLTALALTLATMASYTTLVVSPLEREVVHMRSEIHEMMERELERERAIGRLEGIMGVE